MLAGIFIGLMAGIWVYFYLITNRLGDIADQLKRIADKQNAG